MQLYPDPEEMTKAQDSIQRRLDSFEAKLWVPDREEIIAQKGSGKSKKGNAETVAADNTEAANGAEAVSNAEEKQEKQPKRSTKRSSKRSKSSSVKESKASKSASATRSVRRRK